MFSSIQRYQPRWSLRSYQWLWWILIRTFHLMRASFREVLTRQSIRNFPCGDSYYLAWIGQLCLTFPKYSAWVHLPIQSTIIALTLPWSESFLLDWGTCQTRHTSFILQCVPMSFVQKISDPPRSSPLKPVFVLWSFCILQKCLKGCGCIKSCHVTIFRGWGHPFQETLNFVSVLQGYRCFVVSP